MDIKKLAKYVGHGLVFVSFGFLFYIIKHLDFSSLSALFKLYWIPVLAFLAFLFSLLYFFMAEGWRILLVLASGACLSKEVIATYLKTVVFKYAPGNVFHFLGRHALSESEGISHESIAFANGLEILMQLLAVSAIIMIGAGFFDISLDVHQYITLSKTKILLAFSLLLVVVFAVLFKDKYRKKLLRKEAFVMLAQVFVYHLIFLLGSAMSLIAVYVFLLGIDFDFSMFVQTVFVSAIAWLLGFIVPGAPGGIGIREAILVMLLPAIMMVSKELVLAGALLYRVVSILGEGLTFFWAKLFQK